MARAEGLREYSFSIRVATMTDGVNTTLLYRKTEEDDWKPVITTNFKESFPPQFFSLWVLGSNGAKCGAPHFAPNPERSKIRSRVGERALGRDLMRVLLRIITAYGERRPAELLLRFGRQGPVFIPDRTLTFLIGRQ